MDGCRDLKTSPRRWGFKKLIITMKARVGIAVLVAVICTSANAFISSLFGSGARDELGARGVPIDPPLSLSPRSSTHGVSEASRGLYSGNTFLCGDGKVIPSSAINDEFADCTDGSDEPGTSAGGGEFICRNEGHRPVSIRSSRVDDSICDCCDGSDEGYRVKCSNTCTQEAQAELLAKKGLVDAFEKGSARRKALKDKAKETYNNEVSRIAVMEEELARLLHAKQALQETVDSAEDERRGAVESLTQVAIEKTTEMLRLSDMKDGAVEQMVGAMLDALDVPANDKENLLVGFLESKGVEVKRSPGVGADEEYDPYHGDDEDEQDDYSDYNEMAKLEAGVEGETVPEETDPAPEEEGEGEGVDLPIEHARDFVVHVLEKHSNYEKVAELVGQEHLGHSVSRAADKMRLLFGAVRSVPEVTGRDELAEADDAAASKERELNHAKKYRDQYERFSGGDDNESIVGFLSSNGQQHCVELNDHTYDYSVCFGDDISEAKQGHTSLGTFDRVELDEATGGLVIHFHDGAHCWNHGPRVAEVKVGCGPEDKILSVLEPSTCVYAIDMVSPQACTPAWKDLHLLDNFTN